MIRFQAARMAGRARKAKKDGNEVEDEAEMPA
jgi:hypothetical protein